MLFAFQYRFQIHFIHFSFWIHNSLKHFPVKYKVAAPVLLLISFKRSLSSFQSQCMCGCRALRGEAFAGTGPEPWGWGRSLHSAFQERSERSLCSLHGEGSSCWTLLQWWGHFPWHCPDRVSIPRSPGLCASPVVNWDWVGKDTLFVWFLEATKQLFPPVHPKRMIVGNPILQCFLFL